jgi:hypothetical protein
MDETDEKEIPPSPPVLWGGVVWFGAEVASGDF